MDTLTRSGGASTGAGVDSRRVTLSPRLEPLIHVELSSTSSRPRRRTDLDVEPT